MPVGIQMFATISSKEHLRTLQEDLTTLCDKEIYHDTVLACSDGEIKISRLIAGLLFPHLRYVWSFTSLVEQYVMMPHHTKEEVNHSIQYLLASAQPNSNTGEHEYILPDWQGTAIDNIIDNLRPDPTAKPKTRSATLHSSITRESAVIHASTEDEKDYSEPVLVVNETDEDQAHSSSTSGNAGTKRRISAGVAGAIQPPGIAGAAVHTSPAASSVGSPHAATISSSSGLPATVGRSQIVYQQHQSAPLNSSSQQKSDGDVKMLMPQFCCSICQATFHAKDVLETHMKLHSEKHKCGSCGLVFIKARELTEHQRTHSGHKLVKCDICDKDFTEKGLRLHTDRFHRLESNPVKVETSSASSSPVKAPTEATALVVERKSAPPEPSPPSDPHAKDRAVKSSPDVAKQSYDADSNKVQFSSSSESESEPSDTPPSVKMKKTTCPNCHKLFTKKGLKVHMTRCACSRMEEDLSAADANVPPKKKKLLRGAGERKSAPPLKKLFTCQYCNKKFSHLASMKVHEKVHLGGKPHKCDLCEAKFTNKFELYAHEKTHSAVLPFKCDECLQAFKTADSLHYHKLIHMESRPLLCRYCNKEFKNKMQLDNHERVHTGEKPFKCDHCDNCFETATKLTRHITATHLETKK